MSCVKIGAKGSNFLYTSFTIGQIYQLSVHVLFFIKFQNKFFFIFQTKITRISWGEKSFLKVSQFIAKINNPFHSLTRQGLLYTALIGRQWTKRGNSYHFGGAVVLGVDSDTHHPGRFILAHLIHPLSFPPVTRKLPPHFDKYTYRTLRNNSQTFYHSQNLS